MKKLITIWLFSLTSIAFAQDQADCVTRLDAQMKEMGALTSAQAGQVTYKKLFERAKHCMEQGKCGKADAFLAISEMMVDEQVVAIQRKKIAVLKAFFVDTKPYQNDACAVAQRFPKVLEEVKALNDQQFQRFIQLGQQQFQ
ncbi:hypothetical protein [Massilia rhizosphaerae]|uniref:hypothetical protein n=1 Tax=Massilia rhizosphaerae TaxID=2784389 RepID=UPI0018DC1D51|nr:hypothetical protein [Massilia rhizosphaerae]